jgi:Protein of unknown function (DUF2968)
MRQTLSGFRSAFFLLVVLGVSHVAVAQNVDDAAPQPVSVALAPQPASVALALQPASAALVPEPASVALAPGSQQGAVQQAPAEQSAPVAAEPAASDVGGDVAELQRLISSSTLTEFRTSYNGSFGASLLFYGKEMTYYVALFQQKSFWRVVKTQNADRANAIFNDFVRQTAQLSQIEIRRTELEAQKSYTERMIALSQHRADQLQADLTIAHSQQAQVTARQEQTRQQAKQLDAERVAAQQQLQDVRRRVAELEHENSAGLPTTKH